MHRHTRVRRPLGSVYDQQTPHGWTCPHPRVHTHRHTDRQTQPGKLSVDQPMCLSCPKGRKEHNQHKTRRHAICRRPTQNKTTCYMSPPNTKQDDMLYVAAQHKTRRQTICRHPTQNKTTFYMLLPATASLDDMLYVATRHSLTRRHSICRRPLHYH